MGVREGHALGLEEGEVLQVGGRRIGINGRDGEVCRGGRSSAWKRVLSHTQTATGTVN